MNIKNLFARKRGGQVVEKTGPDFAALMSQQAVDQLLDLLGQYHEPDKLLQEIGKTRSELRRLMADDEIAAALETRRAAVAGTDWHIERGDAPIAVYDFVNEQIDAMIDDTVRAAWQAVPFGYSVIEMIYRPGAGGRVEWDRVAAPPFEWFRPQQDGSIRYFPSYGNSTGYGDPVDSERKFFLTVRNRTVSNPHGEALLAALYWPWFFRTNGWQFWAKFLERHGSPLLVGKTRRDPSAMADALNAAVQSAVLAIHTDDDVLISGASNSGDAFSAFSSAADRRIQKLVLGQTLTTDTGATGSYAAAKVHNEVRDDRRIADCALVAKTVNRMISALVAINFPGAVAPEFIMEDGRGLDAARAERDKILADAGIVKFTRAYIVNNYDLDDGDFVLPDEAAPLTTQESPGAAAASAAGIGRALFAAQPGARFTPQQQAIEDLADALLVNAPPPISTTTIRAAIEAASGPEDLADRLSEIDGAGANPHFSTILERALFAADVMGYGAAERRQQ